VFALAHRVDLLVVESTFLAEDAARQPIRALTAAQAGRVAAECGVRRLVLTHFSQRYDDPARYRAEAGEVVVALWPRHPGSAPQPGRAAVEGFPAANGERVKR
jgi:ribonuclease BN (tRNA processing enzyme)